MPGKVKSVEKIADEEDEALTEDMFRQLYKYQKTEKLPLLWKIREAARCSSSTVTNSIPILKWLPAYSFRRDFVSDVVAGLTVAVMHIPHGLAYGPLAKQTPVVGLYMAVFPTIMYFLFGTSRHISLGTFAIACMMVGEVVSTHATYYTTLVDPDVQLTPNNSSEMPQYSNVEVGITICFLVGALQFVMGLLHLGSLWLLLSNSLVSGFTTGAAVHVATFQIKNFLGVSGGGFRGAFKWELTVIHLVQQVPLTNWITFGVAFCAITILAVFNDQIKPLIQKKIRLKVPVPIELIIIIMGILLSYFLELNLNYNVNIVKTIPTGLPQPIVPAFPLMPSIVIPSFVIAVVIISINLSLASIFAKKGGYVIKQNQELVAYGIANIFASFFQCIPSSASLSRSLVQSSVGGKSLIASLITVASIVMILLFLGPLFEPVPYCVLSAIVVVTLKGLLWQVKDFPLIWRQSKLDGLVWLTTFCSVVLIDLDVGLGVGLVMSVFSLVIRGQKPSVLRLGRIPDSNLFMDCSLYPSAQTFPNILMLRIVGGLHFANFNAVRDKVGRLYNEFSLSNMLRNDETILCVVIDMSCVPSVDPTAAANLVEMYKDFKSDQCQLYLTDVDEHVYDFLISCEFFSDFPRSNVIFSLFDAIEHLS